LSDSINFKIVFYHLVAVYFHEKNLIPFFYIYHFIFDVFDCFHRYCRSTLRPISNPFVDRRYARTRYAERRVVPRSVRHCADPPRRRRRPRPSPSVRGQSGSSLFSPPTLRARPTLVSGGRRPATRWASSPAPAPHCSFGLGHGGAWVRVSGSREGSRAGGLKSFLWRQ
jgi:hypothetical protein